MASNAQKTPLAPALVDISSNIVLDAIQNIGKELPCSVVAVSGQIVTVKFEVNAAPFTLPNVTVPIATSLYDWLPVQPGDEGYCAAASVALGGISGLGSGVADLTPRGNLATLVFVPVSNKSWTAPGSDANKRVVQGPNGILAQDTTGAVKGEFDKTAGISLSFGSGSVAVTSSSAALSFGSNSIVVSASGITINGVLVGTGDATFQQTLGVTSAVTVGGSLGVTSAVTVGGSLGVTGAISTGSTIQATGNITTTTGSLAASTGDVVANAASGTALVKLLHHTHSGVQAGGSDTGAPNPGT